VTSFKSAQSRNAELPILATLLGIVIEVSPEFLKALLPIAVRVSGRVMEVNRAEFLKVSNPIFVTPSGMT
jgi:hypothetical protein